jgi:hypothetical protein
MQGQPGLAVNGRVFYIMVLMPQRTFVERVNLLQRATCGKLMAQRVATFERAHAQAGHYDSHVEHIDACCHCT